MAVLENDIAQGLGYRVSSPKALTSRDRYDFTDADHDMYQILRYSHINSQQFFADMQMMSGADRAIKMLNDMGHRTYLVTARGRDSTGKFDPLARQYVHQTLARWGLLDHGLLIDSNHSFADPTIKQLDKAAQCRNLGITVLVDDDERNVQKVRNAKFSAIHFGVETPDWQAVIARIMKFA